MGVKHVFFVAETKGSMLSMNLKGAEMAKIECAKKLFNNVSTSKVRYHEITDYDTMLNVINSFDEYIRQGEPQKKERAEAWRVAIGLQAVDGLKVSGYLLELARRNIEGEISMEEVDKLLDEYYEEKHRIRDTWREYETYTKIDVHPDPEGSKRGRPI